MAHGGLLERKLKCNEISFSLKTQTETQTFFCVFSLFCLKKLAWFNFFFFHTSFLNVFFCEFK